MAVKVPQSYGFSSYGGNKFLTVFYKYNDYIRWMQSGELTQSEINSKFTQLQNKDTQLTTKINTVENTVNDIIPSLTKTENGLYFCFGYVATTSSALALIIDCNRAIPSDYVIDTENTKVNTIALRLVNGKYVENKGKSHLCRGASGPGRKDEGISHGHGVREQSASGGVSEERTLYHGRGMGEGRSGADERGPFKRGKVPSVRECK